MTQVLKERLELMQSVVENTPLPVGVYKGEELLIVLANQAMIETWGKGDDVIGKRYTEILPELENQDLFEQALSVLKSGTPIHARNKRVDIVIDGVLKEHYFNYSLTALYDNDGKIYGVMNSGADVTDLNMARQQVEETEEILQLAVTSAGLGIYEIDLATDTVSPSGNFHSIWKTEGSVVPREELIKMIHPDDISIRDKALLEAEVTGTLQYEIRIANTSEFWKWIRVTGTVNYDANGMPVTLVGIVQDITEQKKNAAALKSIVDQQTSDLKRSNEDLLQFANVVSHDLKEPVRKISIFNNLLKNNLSDKDKDNVVYLEKIQRSAERMTAIIDGVLNYAELNKSGHPVQKANLNSIIDNIKTDLELLIHEKQAILVTGPLPEIEGIPILLHQLFYNLIHNALKFSKPDDPPRVTISSFNLLIDNLEHVDIVIKDNGIGFLPEYADRIFNAFERLHSKDEFEGTGLGLPLCKKIAERHNGTIEANVKITEGAEFIVRLPIKQKERTV